jgi:concentrative nucleoside transporter, CNT family
MELFGTILRGVFGLTVILAIAFALSSDRRGIKPRTIIGGLLLQIVFAIFVLRGRDMGEAFAPLGWPSQFFAAIASFFVLVLQFMEAGAQFVFGQLAVSPGQDGSLGFFFFAQVLPTIVFFASLMAVLYYLGIMQYIVRGMAYLVSRSLGTSGPESLSVTANIFVGQTESPLVIRPYIKNMSRSELLTIMAGGMATIAGGVMAAYVQLLGSRYAAAMDVPLDVGRQLFAEQLLGASIMAAPAAIVLAKIMIPELRPLPPPELAADPDAPLLAHSEQPSAPLLGDEIASPEAVQAEATAEPTLSAIDSEAKAEEITSPAVESTPQNVIDAAASGAAEGLKLALNVGAMLIAFIALIAMANYFIGEIAGLFGYTLTLEQIFGWVLAPIAWSIGIPTQDILEFGGLLGTKIVLNEFVAYLGLAEAIDLGGLHPKTIVMATFALCGFANFSSIAIQIGGIGPLAPSRTSEIAELGLRAVLIGTLANLMTATIAGVLLG